jgi:hypothetical protein
MQITFDAADPAALGKFWAEVLGYIEEPPPEGHDSWESFLTTIGVPEDGWDSAYAIVDPDGARPRIFIQKVPEPKTAKNRMHFDVNVGGPRGTPRDERCKKVDEAAIRLVSLGARELYRIDEPTSYHVTLADPEGNEFCIQ